jgi:Dolichyl-phosphate-mannose-protein mannosyltransferase
VSKQIEDNGGQSQQIGSRQSEQQPRTKPTESLPRVEVRVRKADSDKPTATAWHATLASVSRNNSRLFVLCLLMVIAGTYVGVRLNESWIAVDDGTLAQSALRVLEGQLPHRDFVEIYTGGLSFLHAAAFRLFGVNLLSLRICVFLFFLAWVPAVYFIVLRFTPPIVAGAVALLAIAWSFPNYEAAMPSWYNLFFATFGAAALLRYLEVRTRRWLVIAGVCGGISILIKVIGFYYIAGVLLFLAFLEQSDNREKRIEKNSRGFRVFSAVALFGFLATLTYVLHRRLAAGEFYHLLLPSVAVVGMILLGEGKSGAGSGERFAALLRLVIPFICGAVIPIVIFLIPYARAGSVGGFFSGTASSTISHAVDLAVARPAPPYYIMFVMPLVSLLAASMYWKRFQGRAVGAAVALLAIVIVVRATQSSVVYSGVWFSVAILPPAVVLAGVASILVLRSQGRVSKLQRERLVLVVALAATCTLVQYPFPVPIYLCYALPMTLLALAAIVTTAQKHRGTYVLASLVGLYLGFAVMCMIPRHIAEYSHIPGRREVLRVPRGGLQIEDESYFEALTIFLQQHAPNGLMYAGNDCPELYFLTGLKNVTSNDNGAPAEEVLKALESTDVKLVVLFESPYFASGQTSPEVRAEVMRRFPQSRMAGIFHVYWRD